MKHASIPVFVPHAACPNNCVFCNQKKIAGKQAPEENVFAFLQNALAAMSKKFDSVDIAFFGGSFTGIEQGKMESYLRVARHFLQNDARVTGIRLSTRPDYISTEILDLLKAYGVSAIELGAQSFCDEVLAACGRGHAAKDTYEAARQIHRYGFELVLQLMPGLPCDTMDTIRETARQAALLSPDGVRLYPCVVIEDTPLYESWKKGEFTPLTVEQAVEICARLTVFFESKGIKILRTGLHSSDLVQNGGVAAGPFHPAFGELVKQKMYYDRADELLANTLPPDATGACLRVGKGCTSQMTGYQKQTLRALSQKYNLRLRVAEGGAPGGRIEIIYEGT